MFSFKWKRLMTAGPAEAAPASVLDPRLWSFPTAEDTRNLTLKGGLMVMCTDTIEFDVYVHNEDGSNSKFFKTSSGLLVADRPTVLPFHFEGARFCVVRKSAIGADATLYAAPSDTGSVIAEYAKMLVGVTRTQAITPDDTAVFDPPLRWITCNGNAGNVAIKCVDDTVAQTIHLDQYEKWSEGLVSVVMATGTTATNLVGGR